VEPKDQIILSNPQRSSTKEVIFIKAKHGDQIVGTFRFKKKWINLYANLVKCDNCCAIGTGKELISHRLAVAKEKRDKKIILY
jgi:hypothetical protein